MAAGENTCGRSGVQEKKKQQKRKSTDDADRQEAKKQKIHVLMPKSKSLFNFFVKFSLTFKVL